jgi:hypothetical protein
VTRQTRTVEEPHASASPAGQLLTKLEKVQNLLGEAYDLKRPFSVAFQPREKNTHSTLGNIAV